MTKRYKPLKGLTYRAERALKKCIKEKWEPLASGKFEGDEEPECVLCETFIGCGLCPVFLRTGITDCYNTPYRAWGTLHSKATFMVPWGEDRRSLATIAYNAPTVVAAAKKELKFLKDTLRYGLAARARKAENG